MLIENSFDVLNVESDKDRFAFSDSFAVAEFNPKFILVEVGSGTTYFHNIEVEFIFQFRYENVWLQTGQSVYWHPTVRPFLLDVPYPMPRADEIQYEVGVRYYPVFPHLKIPHNLQIRFFQWGAFKRSLVDGTF